MTPGGALRSQGSVVVRAVLGLALVLLSMLAHVSGAVAADAPAISSPAAAVVEVSTGEVAFAKRGEEERGMASTTKLMTSLVAVEVGRLGQTLTAASYLPGPAETQIGLQAGERLTLADLIRAMLLPSANDAAHTVAVRVGGTQRRFVEMMNERAQQAGLEHTSFANPIGLDAPDHHTSAIDLAKIGALVERQRFLRKVVDRQTAEIGSGASARTLRNRNRLLGDRLPAGGVVTGMKTGHTNASGYSLVGSATRDGITVVAAVLGAGSEDARDEDTAALLDWGTKQFERRELLAPGGVTDRVEVRDGKEPTVGVSPAERVERVVNVEAPAPTISAKGVPTELEAPVPAGRRAGSVEVRLGDELVAEVPLRTASLVERKSALALAVDWVAARWLLLLASLGLLAGGTLTLTRALRRSHAAV